MALKSCTCQVGIAAQQAGLCLPPSKGATATTLPCHAAGDALAHVAPQLHALLASGAAVERCSAALLQPGAAGAEVLPGGAHSLHKSGSGSQVKGGRLGAKLKAVLDHARSLPGGVAAHSFELSWQPATNTSPAMWLMGLAPYGSATPLPLPQQQVALRVGGSDWELNTVGDTSVASISLESPLCAAWSRSSSSQARRRQAAAAQQWVPLVPAC